MLHVSEDRAEMRNLRSWVKRRDHWAADLLYRMFFGLRNLKVPSVKPIHLPLYHLHLFGRATIDNLLRALWYTPLFQSRLAGPAPQLYLFGGMPLIMGALTIEMGANCRLSGQTTLVGRSATPEQPRLIIGNNVEIGWQTTIAVGTRVVIGNNVLIAGKGFLAGYPGHPIDPVRRAQHQPDTADQIGDIILEDDVWLATNVSILAGVRIGKGTIVTAGSVVFRDLPAGVIATGNPAKVVAPISFGG
jgi:acetyltransferase-like isoleucine patch superfamily enzyme